MTTATARDSSGVGETKPLLDSFDPAVDTVEAIRKVGILASQDAQATFHFPHAVAQAIDSASDVTQMLQHKVVRVGHSYFHSILLIL